MAGRYDIVIDRGANFSLNLNVANSDESPRDLTNFFARAQLRKTRTAAAPAATFACDILDPATGGDIRMSLDNATTGSLDAGRYYYDLEIYTAADAVVERLLEGQAQVTQDVTR